MKHVFWSRRRRRCAISPRRHSASSRAASERPRKPRIATNLILRSMSAGSPKRTSSTARPERQPRYSGAKHRHLRATHLAQRNPCVSHWYAGVRSSRSGVLSALAFALRQLPPRATRYLPVVHGGGEHHQSLVHFQTFPVLSLKPRRLSPAGEKLPAGQVPSDFFQHASVVGAPRPYG